jgi:hypothetical protein
MLFKFSVLCLLGVSLCCARVCLDARDDFEVFLEQIAWELEDNTDPEDDDLRECVLADLDAARKALEDVKLEEQHNKGRDKRKLKALIDDFNKKLNALKKSYLKIKFSGRFGDNGSLGGVPSSGKSYETIVNLDWFPRGRRKYDYLPSFYHGNPTSGDGIVLCSRSSAESRENVPVVQPGP